MKIDRSLEDSNNSNKKLKNNNANNNNKKKVKSSSSSDTENLEEQTMELDGEKTLELKFSLDFETQPTQVIDNS
jgi:hypothetical protein